MQKFSNSNDNGQSGTQTSQNIDGTSKKDFFIVNADVVRLETSIKDRFKVLLNRIGRSQNWLAGEVGISTGTMSRIVNGEWYPSSQIMVRISEILETQSVVLFGDSKYWKEWNEKIIYPKEDKK
jgi:DNA-binding XRE family transcriptional regulator